MCKWYMKLDVLQKWLTTQGIISFHVGEKEGMGQTETIVNNTLRNLLVEPSNR